MLNFKKIVGIVAIVAIIGFAFFSCDDGGGGGVVPGLTSGPAAKDVVNFTSEFVANENAAKTLFATMASSGVGGILGTSITAGTTAAKGDYNWIDFIEENATKKSYTNEFKLDTDAVQTAFKGGLIGVSTDASVSGKVKISWSSNDELGLWYLKAYSTTAWNKNDNYKNSSEVNVTYKLPKLAGTSDLFGGTVKVESSISATTKYTEVDPSYVKSLSGNSSAKYSATVSYDNGSTEGAKFRFSYSKGGKYNRAGESGDLYSDVEVCKNDGTVIYSFQDDTNIALFFSKFDIDTNSL